MTPSPDSLRASRPSSVALVGCLGHNARTRLLPELHRLNGHLCLTGYDLQPAPAASAFPCFQVRGVADLAERLHADRPEVVILETPDDTHPELLRVALESGARRVLCEKCLAPRAADALALVTLAEAVQPAQEVHVIDHYAGLGLWHTLLKHGPRLLGRVQHLDVTLFEAQGVPPQQERSHTQGMANFAHHVLALAQSCFDLADLEPVEGAWSRHPETGVPDTYRAAQFRSRSVGRVVLTGAVGKYMPVPRKTITVIGERGHAVLDRTRGELRIRPIAGGALTFRDPDPDTGYRVLAHALATGTTPPTLLSVPHAAHILRLLEQAHALAERVPLYAAAHEFVCDWQMPSPSGFTHD